jgi:hypothetical protein
MDMRRSRAGPSFQPSCLSLGGSPGPCVPGGRIVFRVEPAGYGAFSALAETPEGNTVWYFPGADRPDSVDLQNLPKTGVLGQVAVVPADSVAGEYVLHGVFSRVPLGKDEIREALSTGRPDATALERRIRVLVP